jgi:hypothetical protein
MKGPITVRIADASDAELFAEWIADSTHIPYQDVQDSLKESNPTSVTLVMEQDGKVLLFFPTYAIAMLGFIGFNPDTSDLERLRALDAAKRAAQAFWSTYGVTEIATLTKEHYPIAQWAMRHGFEMDERQIVKLKTKPAEGKAN